MKVPTNIIYVKKLPASVKRVESLSKECPYIQTTLYQLNAQFESEELNHTEIWIKDDAQLRSRYQKCRETSPYLRRKFEDMAEGENKSHPV